MKNKKIVDYIVVSGESIGLNFFDRINSKMEDIESHIGSIKCSIGNKENISKSIKKLEKDLAKFKDNNDPITNKDVRTVFENQVLNLVKKGYEPLGGISISKYCPYQAMVKYED